MDIYSQDIYSHVTSPRPSPPHHSQPSPLSTLTLTPPPSPPDPHPSQEELPPVDTRATLHDAPDTVRFGDQLPEVLYLL